MNVKVLSLLVSALLLPGVANAVEFYNKDGNKLDFYSKMSGVHLFSNKKDSGGDQTCINFGLKGETQLNDKLTGYAKWEYQVQGDTNRDNSYSSIRVAFAGLKFSDGSSFDYGRNYGIIYDVSSWTNVLPEFGGNIYAVDNFMQSCASSVATYRNQDFFGLINGLNFALQYQGKNNGFVNKKETAIDRDLLKQNGDGWGISLIYDLGEGFSVGGAMASSNRIVQQNIESVYGEGGHAEIYSGAFKYDANNIYLAAQYSQTYNATRLGAFIGKNNSCSEIYGLANKAQNLEVVAQYQFDFGLRPSISYLQSKAKDLEGYGDQDLLKCVDVSARYVFNNNMSTYVDYKVNLINTNNIFTRVIGIGTDDVVALGLVYQF